jgi:hypothetical protein
VRTALISKCPRRLLGHGGAWLEWRFSRGGERNVITIKNGFENYELILIENE